MTTKKIVGTIALLLGVVIVAIVSLWQIAQSETLYFELVKFLLQLILIVGIGGAVATGFRFVEEDRRSQAAALDRERAWQSVVRTSLADYLGRVGIAYRSVKAARRQLRAVGLTRRYGRPPSTLTPTQCGAYAEQIMRISEAQLAIEALEIEASSLGEYASLKGLADYLHTMQKYVRSIVSEFEEHWPRHVAGQDLHFDSLPKVDEFTGGDNSTGKSRTTLATDFSAPYREVIREIRRSVRGIRGAAG